jgi:hypothetical protein
MCSGIVPERSYKIVGDASFSIEDGEEKGLRVIADNCNGMIFFHGFFS